jgi:serine/threonine protein kinase/tetratricopeptide (TPR) repeat protein
MLDRPSATTTVIAATHVRGVPSAELDRLAGDIQREMIAAWQAGLPISAEQWLDRHPQMSAEPELAVLVIYEELCLREECGEKVDSAEIYRRFPQFEDALSVVLGCHRLIHSAPAQFPVAGEEFGEFRLLRELGRGGAGRVFLAVQPALSDRPLVVKFTPRTGAEHLSLARLQHTHIVPLFLVQEFPQRNLRALCMPFLGGASWSRILQGLQSRGARGLTGEGIAQVLAESQCDLRPTVNSTGPAIGFLQQASYEQAICWIGSCLADALHYAHQRGLLHLDIKPSNVLLAGDGQPMLLDFHLAHEVDQAQHGPIDELGGTRGYMSPEQQSCLDALRAGRILPVALDPRSDIYSLGVLLYESLCGQNPPADERTSRLALRRANPQVSRSLEDLLHKCLAPDRDARYSCAGELATDLRRHIANLPLRGVANRSFKERWQKWRRRKPHSLSTWAVGLTALIAISGASLFFYQDRLQTARTALDRVEQDLTGGNHTDSLEQLAAGLKAIRWLPGQHDLKQTFQTRMAAERRARVFRALHHLVEQLRFLDNVAAVPPAKLRELDSGCRAIWETRREIAPADPVSLRTQSSKEDIELLDLALLWTRLTTRNAAPGSLPAEQSKALTVLDEAQDMWGPTLVLRFARAQLTGQLDATNRDASLQLAEMPRTAWELDAIGRSLLQAGQLDRARESFERAVEMEPGEFWPYFHLAQCDYRAGRFDQALRSAGICVALSPRAAECYFNRALCLQSVGQSEAASKDFTHALELDPGLGIAVFQRGLVFAELGRLSEALDDFSQAAELGTSPARAYYQMALIYSGQKDWTAAKSYVERSLRYDATYAPARSLQTRLKTSADPTASRP